MSHSSACRMDAAAMAGQANDAAAAPGQEAFVLRPTSGREPFCTQAAGAALMTHLGVCL